MIGGADGFDIKRPAAEGEVRNEALDRRQRELDEREAELDRRENAVDAAERLREDIREANGHLVLATIAAEHLEEATRHSKKQQDEFIAMLAHELRNPLAPIRSAATLLEHYGAASTDPRIASVSAIIVRQVAQMARLLDDLLDAARVTSGKVTLQRRSVSVSEFVSASVEATCALIEARHQTLTLEVPAEDFCIDGDPARLAQVCGNLLHNASKYTPEGGSITLSARRSGDDAILTVADNGGGISEDALPGIFDLFTQEHRSLSRSQGGLGLGLAVVRSMVEIHGGTISAYSQGAGQGATFTIVLPAIDVDPEPTFPPSAPIEFKPVRVLVVDDNQDAAEMLTMLLEALGYEVVVAYDGEAAVAKCAEQQPQVVLCDIGLPGMDGYEVARCIRSLASPPSPRPLLIALTGYDSPADRAKTMASGFDFHIAKPADIDAIQKMIAGYAHPGLAASK